MFKVRLLIVLPLTALIVTMAGNAAQPKSFIASLSGSQHIPPVNTRATGQFNAQVNADGTSLSFELAVFNIEGVSAAHIHCAPAFTNGPPGVTLFNGPTTGIVNVTLAEATIMFPDFRNGCSWTNVADVVAAMESGDTYVNVHTTEFRSGEIRGQVGSVQS